MVARKKHHLSQPGRKRSPKQVASVESGRTRLSPVGPGEPQLPDYDVHLLSDLIAMLATVPYGRLLWGLGGQLLTKPVRGRWSPLCRLIQGVPEGLRRCLECDDRLMEAARKAGKARIHTCHAGLVDFVIPIVVRGKYAGLLMAGQAIRGVPSERRKKQLMRRIRDLPLDPIEVEQAILETPSISQEMLSHVVRMVWEAIQFAAAGIAHRKEVLSHFIASGIGSRPTRHVTLAIKYVRHNLNQPLSVSKICRDVLYVDRFYFSRIFRRATGMSFGQYVKQQKIEEAKYLLANSELPLKRVASAAGFSDFSYFGRIFKKMVGQPPSRFRARARMSE